MPRTEVTQLSVVGADYSVLRQEVHRGRRGCGQPTRQSLTHC